MSAKLLGYLSKRFGCSELSDCTIVFHQESSPVADKAANDGESINAKGAPDAKQDVQDVSPKEDRSPAHVPIFGDPLPAHILIVCGGSDRLGAQRDGWKQESGPDSKPLLRVPLHSADELPHALSALKFIYTGEVTAGSSSDLLHIRRQAAYLQVDGCVEACDEALLARINGLAGVQEIYACSKQLPDPEQTEEPDGAEFLEMVLKTCRQKLVEHCKNGCTMPDGGPNLGELLAWSFRDAPSVLSEPETRRQMEALPAAAMEALLGSQHFATDDEATVLLMLACWLEVNRGTSEEARWRLCKLVRLSKLCSTYLFQVLPLLPWFPLSPKEHRFLCEYACENEDKQASLAACAGDVYDCRSPWYSADERPAASAGQPYDWYVPETDLTAKYQALVSGEAFSVSATFGNGASRIAVNGFEWLVGISRNKGATAAGVFLECCVPKALGIRDPKEVVSSGSPGTARVVAYKWREDGSREEASRYDYDGVGVPIGKGVGTSEALPLVISAADDRNPGAAVPCSKLLEPWAPYLKDAELHGLLEWV